MILSTRTLVGPYIRSHVLPRDGPTIGDNGSSYRDLDPRPVGTIRAHIGGLLGESSRPCWGAQAPLGRLTWNIGSVLGSMNPESP